MPSLEAQAALIKHVYESNGLDFGSTQYVEAHGTGTKAGDPIEAEAIYSTIGKGASRRGKLWMGSLKPNVRELAMSPAWVKFRLTQTYLDWPSRARGWCGIYNQGRFGAGA